MFLFLIPGFLLVLAGLVQLALFGVSGGVTTMVAKSLLAFALFVGVQLLVLGAAATASTDQLLLGRARRVSTWVSTEPPPNRPSWPASHSPRSARDC